MLRVFPHAVPLADFYPYWDAVEVEDAGSTRARTLAFDVVQQLVCAAAYRVRGNASADFVRAVCRWRRGQPESHQADDDICALLGASEAATRRAIFGESSERRTRAAPSSRHGGTGRYGTSNFSSSMAAATGLARTGGRESVNLP